MSGRGARRPKGINQWSMPDAWGLRRCFEVARDAGFDGVELVFGEYGEVAGPAGGAELLASPHRYLGLRPYANDEFCITSTREEVTAIRALAEEVGVAIPSITSVLPFLHPLTADDPEVRERGSSILRRGLEFAEILGAETLLVVPGVVEQGTHYEEALSRARSGLEALAPEAEAHNVVLAVENVWNGMLYDPSAFRDFVGAVGSPWVKAYVDVGNVVRTGFGDDWLRLLGEHVDKVHFCNFRGEVGNLGGFTRHLLDGDVDWPGVIHALDAIGYDGWVTAEVTPPAPHYPEKVVRDIASTMDWILARGAPDATRVNGGRT